VKLLLVAELPKPGRFVADLTPVHSSLVRLLLVELQKSEDSGFDLMLAHYFSVGLLLVGLQKSEQKSERFGADLRLVD
jgi:hypothetical protein